MRKSILVCALMLFCAGLGGALPAAAQGTVETAAVTAPAAATSASWPRALIPALASADCAAELVAAAVSEEPNGIALCGACSQEGCAHAEIGAICGISGDEYKFCIYDGDICRHAGYKCNCRVGPI